MFTLFVTSLFWCFMADVFRSEQAKRLFGFIGVGGTLGSVAGSAATAVLAKSIGDVNLLLVSCVLLELATVTVARFPLPESAPELAGDTDRQAQLSQVAQLQGRAVGGNLWAGFTHTVKSPYLLGIAVFLVLFTIGSTFLYFEQSSIVGATFTDRATRTAVLARVELLVQVLTVLTQIFLTGRIIRWFGLVSALAFLPVVSMLGFGALASVPVFGALAAFVVLRRAGNFALTNPGMEVLFTVVPREDKYKAKSFIETFVYRGGDQIGAWTFAGLTALGLGLSAISWVAVPMSAVWLALGVWLSRRQSELARQ
jgi:AAA family ATP:ADP antiporter